MDTAKFDGKDYSRTGSPHFDSVAMERIDAHTWRTVLGKGGQMVAESIEMLLGDGKVYTVKVRPVSSAAAKRYRSIVEIFERE